VHLNRVIKERDLNMIYIAGPGHGGPGLVANTYLEGTYSEVYPNISPDVEGMRKLFKQFSFPGGIPSHVAPETPGSIHEGGELGYALSHAFGAIFDNPNLMVARVVGDGEAETGPLATAWHSNKFLNPLHVGAVLPILHLNGYKIANPTVLARISHEELESLFVGYGYKPYVVEGAEPEAMHQLMAATLDTVIAEIQTIQHEARTSAVAKRPRWPMIILRTPKGWTCPKEVDGLKLEGYWRSHQVPITDMATKPGHLKLLEEWMKSYKPEQLFDEHGKLLPQLTELAPQGTRRMGANPHANGGLLLKELKMPDFRDYAVDFPKPGTVLAEATRIVDSMFNQHAKWLKTTRTEIPWRAPIASLNYLLTSHVWRQDHNGFSHQDPGFIDHVVNKKAEVIRVYLPPDANTLLSVADHCLRNRDYVNVIVAGKQPALQYLDMEAAVMYCTAGIGMWGWASSDRGTEPDVVMACAGDVPTLETLAAVALPRQYFPELKVRVVNVVDLMKLQPASEHPHGLPDKDFDTLFTTDKPIIFAYHGYPWLIHRLTYRRTNHQNLHVRGYKEEGTTTTPFDMVVRNDLDRFHLVQDVIDRVPKLGYLAAYAKQDMRDKLIDHKEYITQYGEDMPEVRDWKWPAA
jgi:phosphoketolase